MNQEERRVYIKRELEFNKKVEIENLSLRLRVSEMTIRRDLEYLENKGVLTRVSKGAILNLMKSPDKIDDSLSIRNNQNIKGKKRIAKYASKIIEDEDIIYLDASTTIYELCPYILDKHLTIVTNSIRIAEYFNTSKNITVMLAGGVLRYGTLSLIGEDTEKFLKQYNTNKIFISGKALSYENGLTDINMFEINTKKVVIENTNEVIVLLDSTKLNKTSLLKICDIKQISKIIVDDIKTLTDEEEKTLKFIRNNNIDIIIAKSSNRMF
ncbi:DeoR/GlpR family DNA-binding transcription regulator [Clostridium botulinum]|uniref:DeoR/GlpR family DNA-binding transcription regulator n=1 Tax=Clostridium botulinum TaxID=1491 RepID=UPI001E5B074F|nr:DeoR/GlpR family DNA-binding transcription regulator [Clostridium botulinum]MCD3203235.1 DeoR/GlpR transcriptional regulator [Clostridium botulinum C/D]MCD3221862.1 DeoR/GlpR transcriptional regulator [Clostridium botulinum C/D]MCD3230330.1 DeoR/GlpR transcriptional regulator [Clostridium botulinum C/D]MCD3272636.1 DeoR/GlpR transcriptional regulator [Clostridium botulinum C/D]MCD3295708.1 DeoR/GlpR transcriptional regulator [Clostridium botulinum C/D]